MPPHCSYCEHFQPVFHIDNATEWGYCGLVGRGKIPPHEELRRIEKEVESGNYQTLLEQAAELGIFTPEATDCKDFSDFYPF